MSISRLLVVDDDDEMRDMMTEYLRKHGFMALGAASLAGTPNTSTHGGTNNPFDSAGSSVFPAAAAAGDARCGESRALPWKPVSWYERERSGAVPSLA